MNDFAIESVLVREEHVPRLSEMGVPVPALGRMVGVKVVEFPPYADSDSLTC